MPSEGAGSLIENKISKNQIASFPFVESTHFILLARNEPHRSSMFICSCSKAGCPHVLLHGAGEREDSVALHGWDFIKKLLWCIISTLLNSSDTSFHKSLLGCQVRLTWRSCNSITATRLVRHAGIVLLYRQPEHEWSEFIHVPSLDFISSRSWRKVILRLQCCFTAGAEHWFIWSTITRRQSKL